jgi:hypothetical protein
VTPRRSIAACLLVCCLAAHTSANPAPGSTEPSPSELSELYLLESTAGRARERPAAATAADRPSPPVRGVAGTSRTQRSLTLTTQTTLAAQDRSSDDGIPLSFAVLLGALAAAIVLLGLATLPLPRVPWLAALRADRRLDLALAGAVTLLIVTVVYLAFVS